MLADITEARSLGGSLLFLRFDDGTEGSVDLASLVRFEGVFAALRDPAYVAQVTVNRELGTVVWPNGADLCPDVLHARICGTATSPTIGGSAVA